MLRDMVVPGVERRDVARIRDLDDVVAEAAPEARLAVPPDAAALELLVDARPLELVVHDEVVLERLAAVAHLVARLRGFVVVVGVGGQGQQLELLVALPRLVLEVLAVLVPFPVVLAAEATRALRAPVRLGVPLHMFSNGRGLCQPAKSQDLSLKTVGKRTSSHTAGETSYHILPQGTPPSPLGVCSAPSRTS